jgi:phosphopantothenoylcysteine decarboxylase / phosphopantothenate---cysteine ligase
MLAGKKIILGITGSIAAYKAALLVRLLVKEGAEVKVVMTESAKRFVGELTFSNLSQQPVFSGLWDGNWTEHVHLGAWADLMVIAPASANTLAKMANGICDNALLAVYLSAKCPVLAAPAMDADMYVHPSTQRNLARLAQDGVTVLEAGIGFLASGLHGAGRMAEPEDILHAVTAQFGMRHLEGKKVLVSAGPTREHIDPVRFISNGSTGTMGYAIAAAAHQLGATVTLVSGPIPPPMQLPFAPIFVDTAQDMLTAMLAHSADQDYIVMTAAVGDYKPAEVAEQKIKKGQDDLLLRLVRTQDILAQLGAQKPAGQVLIGFALETHDEEAYAKKKLEAKNLDFVVMNSLRDPGAGFGTDTNKITLFSRRGDSYLFPLKSKVELAQALWATILNDIQHA